MTFPAVRSHLIAFITAPFGNDITAKSMLKAKCLLVKTRALEPKRTSVSVDRIFTMFK